MGRAAISEIDPKLRQYATERQAEYMDAVSTYGSLRAAARALGVNYGAVQASIQALESKGIRGTPPRRAADELIVPNPPDADEPIADLIARKKARFTRDSVADAYYKLVPIGVKQAGPVAICAIGDPHVDDDRCDISALERDMTIIGRTEAMHALHVGDITNNWVGRLGRLYAHQSTTAGDGIRLAKHMFDLAPPLAVVGGNHDLWNEGMSWLNFCVRQAAPNALVQSHGVRLEVSFPNGKSVRIHCRHDFPGHSQFNPVHGLRKEHLFGLRDHINIAGHKHVDTYAVIPSPDGYLQHMLRVSGYKGHDDYAKQGNLQEMKMGPTCALVIDPDANTPAGLVRPFWDIAEAADWLAFKRRRSAGETR